MELSDLDLIRTLSQSNWELRTLHKAHSRYEEELKALDARAALTPPEQIRKREIQKQKLAGKDRMMAICAEHRRAEQAAKPGRNTRRGLPDLTA